MKSRAHSFRDNASHALGDAQLQKAMGHVRSGFIDKRRKAVDRMPEFEALRDQARDIKIHTLDNLDFYLERYEQKVIEAGGQVHWAPDAADARRIILDICRHAGARTVTKGKSMISEEVALNEHLEAAVHHSASRRAAEPHHRAGRPRHQGAGARGFSQTPCPPAT
jgi:L-lactate dehydrogenase complex protein LldF